MNVLGGYQILVEILFRGAKNGANFSFKAYCNLVKRVEVVILLLSIE